MMCGQIGQRAPVGLCCGKIKSPAMKDRLSSRYLKRPNRDWRAHTFALFASPQLCVPRRDE